jgi:hypothetical protein
LTVRWSVNATAVMSIHRFRLLKSLMAFDQDVRQQSRRNAYIQVSQQSSATRLASPLL